MPDTQKPPLAEPGKRTGKGVASILPYLHKQVQAQIQLHINKPPTSADQNGRESRRAKPKDSPR